MGTVIAVPVEEYLATSYQPDREYIDGELLERNVGEHYHSWMQTLTIALLNERSGSEYRVLTEQRVKISATKYLVPDVCVKKRPYRITPVIEQPDIVVEVMSPDDTFPEMLDKTAKYLASGCGQIWILNPYKREAHVADLEGVVKQEGVNHPLTGKVSFTELFAKLDETD